MFPPIAVVGASCRSAAITLGMADVAGMDDVVDAGSRAQASGRSRPCVSEMMPIIMGDLACSTRSARAFVGPLRIEVLRDLGVASVDIGAKLQLAIELRERRLVDHEDRHGLWHGAADGVAGRDGLFDGLERLLHHQGGQLLGVVDPDAAMADAAVVAGEQMLRRGVVQVNVEPVGSSNRNCPSPAPGPARCSSTPSGRRTMLRFAR